MRTIFYLEKYLQIRYSENVEEKDQRRLQRGDDVRDEPLVEVTECGKAVKGN